MANPLNHVTLVGRLARDPKVNTNKNDSKTVLATIAVDNNFKSRDGEAKTNFIPVRAYVSERVNGVGGWANVTKGSLVALQANLDVTPYQDASGETVYPLTVEVEGFPQFLEPASVTANRRKEQEAEQAAAPAADDAGEDRVAALERQLAEERAKTAGEEPPF